MNIKYHYLIQLEPRARGGYVCKIYELTPAGFEPGLYTTEDPKDVQATGIANGPQEALLAAAKQWAGEK